MGYADLIGCAIGIGFILAGVLVLMSVIKDIQKLKRKPDFKWKDILTLTNEEIKESNAEKLHDGAMCFGLIGGLIIVIMSVFITNKYISSFPNTVGIWKYMFCICFLIIIMWYLIVFFTKGKTLSFLSQLLFIPFMFSLVIGVSNISGMKFNLQHSNISCEPSNKTNIK